MATKSPSSSTAPDTSMVAELEMAARGQDEIQNQGQHHGQNQGPAERLGHLLRGVLVPRTVIGAAGGCLATVTMTVAMLTLQRALPRREQYPLPPRRIIDVLARRLGLRRKMDRAELDLATAIGHFGYGTAAGALYGPLGLALPVPGVGSGVVYGMLVWAASYLGLLPALGILPPATQHPAGRNALMIAAHVVWGASLGWLAERIAVRSGER